MMTFLQDNRHEIVVAERDASGKHYVLRARVPPNPEALEWGVIIGEIAHNLRAALDGLVWQLIIANKIEPSSLFPRPEYPIYIRGSSSIKGVHTFEGQGRARLRGVHRRDKATIDATQPYHRRNAGRNSTLWLLQELNNADKHRLVQVAAVGTANQWSNFTFSQPASGGMPHSEMRKRIRFYRNRFLVDGAKVGVADAGIPDVVNMKLLPITEIAFSEGCPAVYRRPVFRILDNMGMHVSNIIHAHFQTTLGPLPDEWLKS
jgi:hypothetical protein